MTVNKFMHPRNIYKTPPNFTDLAIEYPEFKTISILDVSGKVKIDFKNQETLRILTKCLLHKDFKLDVILPQNKLVPTLSLRLNYILWIEDILNVAGIASNITGIDIGCGASCIYGLIAAQENKWKMFGLETDSDSCDVAKSNIQKNQLGHLIELIHESDNTRIFDQLQKHQAFHGADFCVCNPPFFGGLDELNFSSVSKNRTGNRPLPHNGQTGSNVELIVDGGECSFVQKIIKESCQLKDRIKVYTTMLGHKTSVPKITKMLLSQGITNFSETEFCQGRTTRWGVAWTFCPDIYLRTVPIYGQNIVKNKIFTHHIPKTDDNDIHKSVEIIENIFSSVNLIVKSTKFININNVQCIVVAPIENTWSKQRQKKRERERRDKPHLENEINEKKESQVDDATIKITKDISENHQHVAKKQKLHKSDPVTCESESPFLVFQCSLEKNDNTRLNLEYLYGKAGKDGVYQIFQLLINRLS